MKSPKLALVAVAVAAVVSLGACSSNKKDTAGSGAAVTPVANLTSLSGKATSVTLDPGFLSALTSLKLTPGVVGKATLTGAVISFPITGGNVKYFTPGSTTPYVQGIIHHAGSGLSLTAGGKKVELTDFDVDPGMSILTGKVTVDGTVAVASAPLFFLDGRTLNPLASEVDGTGTATLEGTTVSITPEAAALLNKTFGTTAVTPFFKVGIAKIVVNTK